MTKPLEPTEEQVAVLLAFLYPDEKPGVTFGLDSPTAENLREQAHETWALIRDQVLEHAAKACEAVALAEELTREVSMGAPGAIASAKAAEKCAHDIRAMKGMP